MAKHQWDMEDEPKIRHGRVKAIDKRHRKRVIIKGGHDQQEKYLEILHRA